MSAGTMIVQKNHTLFSFVIVVSLLRRTTVSQPTSPFGDGWNGADVCRHAACEDFPADIFVHVPHASAVHRSSDGSSRRKRVYTAAITTMIAMSVLSMVFLSVGDNFIIS